MGDGPLRRSRRPGGGGGVHARALALLAWTALGHICCAARAAPRAFVVAAGSVAPARQSAAVALVETEAAALTGYLFARYRKRFQLPTACPVAVPDLARLRAAGREMMTQGRFEAAGHCNKLALRLWNNRVILATQQRTHRLVEAGLVFISPPSVFARCGLSARVVRRRANWKAQVGRMPSTPDLRMFREKGDEKFDFDWGPVAPRSADPLQLLPGGGGAGADLPVSVYGDGAGNVTGANASHPTAPTARRTSRGQGGTAASSIVTPASWPFHRAAAPSERDARSAVRRDASTEGRSLLRRRRRRPLWNGSADADAAAADAAQYQRQLAAQTVWQEAARGAV